VNEYSRQKIKLYVMFQMHFVREKSMAWPKKMCGYNNILSD
jgi:hypothetical protein